MPSPGAWARSLPLLRIGGGGARDEIVGDPPGRPGHGVVEAAGASVVLGGDPPQHGVALALGELLERADQGPPDASAPSTLVRVEVVEVESGRSRGGAREGTVVGDARNPPV